MSVELKNICKSYDNTEILTDLSFKINKGELVGFLGPNGAGKSTTFRILTGLVSADSGDIIFNGGQVNTSTRSWKSKIGYLAEHNPLYQNMYLVQFLEHICRLHNLPPKKERIENVMNDLELQEYRSYKIKDLSKGYRQRVGIAQAIINDPEILIFDEPTSGLDPNQLIEIRKLFKKLSSDRIIILSSHILSEVEEVCNRVILINKGKIVLDGGPEMTGIYSKKCAVNVEFDRQVETAWFDKLGKIEYYKSSKNKIEIILSKKEDRTQVFDIAVEREVKIVEMKTVNNELEIRFSALRQ